MSSDNKMNVQILASTKPGFVLSKEDALNFGAKMAGVCYSPDGYDSLENEPIEKTHKRRDLTLSNGHQSVYEHAHYTLYLEGLPKVLAMVLNNEKNYVTSEKSARYTKMNPSPKEKVLYDKWDAILGSEIADMYPDLGDVKIKKLAQENARYMISAFTPTKMVHTLDFRQLNYVLHWFNQVVDSFPENNFLRESRESMDQFGEELKSLFVPELHPQIKERYLSLFSKRDSFENHFGDVYSISYDISFGWFGAIS